MRDGITTNSIWSHHVRLERTERHSLESLIHFTKKKLVSFMHPINFTIDEALSAKRKAKLTKKK